MDIAGVTVL